MRESLLVSCPWVLSRNAIVFIWLLLSPNASILLF
jgi:hypothetical protein